MTVPAWIWLLVLVPIVMVVTRRNQGFRYKKPSSVSAGEDRVTDTPDNTSEGIRRDLGLGAWLSSTWFKKPTEGQPFWAQMWFVIVAGLLLIATMVVASMNQEWLFANWYYAAAFALAAWGYWTNRKKYPWTAVVFYVLVGGFIVLKIFGKLLNDLVGADADGNNIVEGIFAKGLAQTQAFFIAIRDSELPLYQEPRVWVLAGIGLLLVFIATRFGGPAKVATTSAKPAAKKSGSALGGVMTVLLMFLLMGGAVAVVAIGAKEIGLSNASWGGQPVPATKTAQLEQQAIAFCQQQDVASYEGRPILGLDLGSGLHWLGRKAGLTASQETVPISQKGWHQIGLCPSMAANADVIYKDVYVAPTAGSVLTRVEIDPDWQKQYRPARGLFVVYGYPPSFEVNEWPEDVLGYAIQRTDTSASGYYRIVISVKKMAEYKLGGLLVRVNTSM